MDDTETYLNSILKKRLGSVPNHHGNTKSAQTVTRIPKQQEKLEHMPTVFRKKHETKYVPNTQQPYNQQQQSHHYTNTVILTKNNKSSRQSGLGNEQSNFGPNQEEQNNRVSQRNEYRNSSQRVEYMLISKRIESLKKEEPIMPTVDVTKYKMDKQSRYPESCSNGNEHDNDILQGQQMQEDYRYSNNRNTISSNTNKNIQLGSVMSLNSANQSKRKRIFGNNNKNVQSLQ